MYSCIFIYMVGTCGLKTPGMLACTGLRRINYGSGCGRKDFGPYAVPEVVRAPIDLYTTAGTGLIGAGPMRHRRP